MLTRPLPRPAPAAQRSILRRAPSCDCPDEPLRRAPLAAHADPERPEVHASELVPSSGRPLDEATRREMEAGFGHDFARVRIHADGAASDAARRVSARAFTLGDDVVFGAGEYAPDTVLGRHLLAHELAHVVQNDGAARRAHGAVAIGRADDPAERAADAAADSFVRDAPVALAPHAGAALRRTPSLTATDFDALADSLHDAVTATSRDEELIYVALQKLERDATAIKSLEAAYKKKFKSNLLGDLGGVLTGHGLALAKTLLGVKKGLAVATTAPSKPADFEKIARAVNAAIVAKTVDPESVYAALIPLGRDPTLVASVQAAYKKAFSSDIEKDLAAKLAGADLSYALYLLFAPAAAGAHSPSITYTTKPAFGSAAKTATVGGGTVSVETAMQYAVASKKPNTPPNNLQFGFGYEYSGALSADTRWLQFIAREIDATTSQGTTPVSGNVTVRSNTYPLTTNPQSPSWIVDSYDPNNPFFDETHGSTSFRDATSVSAFDSPSAVEKVVNAAFTKGVTQVTSSARFDIYLVRDFAPIFHTEIEIVWTFSAPGKRSATTRTIQSTGAVTSLPSDRKSALVARYPAFAYIT